MKKFLHLLALLCFCIVGMSLSASAVNLNLAVSGGIWGNTFGNSNSYSNHSISTDVYKVTLTAASKQSGTITDIPVVKASDIILQMLDGSTLSEVTVNFRQWGTKTQNANVYYSLDGSNYVKINSSSYTLNASNLKVSTGALPSGVVAVKVTTTGSDQVGVASIDYTLNSGGGSDASAPSKPSLSLQSGSSVKVGDKLTINFESGATLKGTVGTASVSSSTSPYTYTFTKADVGQFNVNVYASKNGKDSDNVTASYTVQDDSSTGGEVLSCTLNSSNFKGSGNSYAKYTYTDNGFTYTSVFAMTSGTMQFNTSNNNGKASAIVVTTTNPDYIIKAIDVKFGTKGAGVKIYSRNQAFGDLTLGTAPTIPTDAKQIGGTITDDTKNININAEAFAVYPGGSGVIQVSEVTVYYEKATPKEDVTISFGSTKTFTANLKDKFTAPELKVDPQLAKSEIQYSSTNPLVATVDQNGSISLVGRGETTIKAEIKESSSYNDASDSYTLTVLEDYNSNFSNLTLEFGQTAKINFGDAHPNNISFEYNPTGVVTIDNNGNITINKAGTTEVTVSWAKQDFWTEGSDKFTVTVSKAQYNNPFGETSYTLNVGETKMIPLGSNHPVFTITPLKSEFFNATVEGNNLKIEALMATVSQQSLKLEWGDDNWEIGKAEINVNVVKITYDYNFKKDFELFVGDNVKLFNNENHPNFNVKINDDSKVISFDESTQSITALKPGSASLKITWGDDTYETGEAIVNVTVSKAPSFYQIVFKTGGSNTNTTFKADKNNPTLADQTELLQGEEYVGDVTAGSNSFPNTAEGIRVGSGSGAGYLKFNLSDKGKVNATKIIIHAKGSNNNYSKLDLSADYSSNTNHGKSISTADYADYEFELDGSLLESINIYGYYRVYIDGITVYYLDETPAKEPVATPTINIEEESDVTIGSTLIISTETEGATFSGYIEFENDEFEDISLEEEPLPYTLTLDDPKMEGLVSISGWASKDGFEDSEPIEDYMFTLIIPTPTKPVIKIGEEILEGSSKEVEAGTVITIDAENATGLFGYIGEDVTLDNEKLPYEYTVTEDVEVNVWAENYGKSGDMLEYAFTVKAIATDPDMPAIGSRFKQLLNGDEVTEGIYVIARHAENGDNTQSIAMSVNANGSNISSTGNITVETVNVWRPIYNEEKPQNSQPYRTRPMSVITTTADDVLVVRIEKNDEGLLGIKTLNWGDGSLENQGYLNGPNESGATTLEVAKEFVPAYFSLTQNDNTNIFFKEGSKRSIGTPTSGEYFNYQGSGNAIQLYRLTEANYFDPQYEDIVLDVNTEYEIIPTVSPAPENIKYQVKGNTTVIKIQDGNRIIASERPSEDIEVVVVATWEETDQWFSGMVEIPVSVRMVLQDFGFRWDKVFGKKDVGVLSQAVYYTGNGKVTYSSSDPEELQVNEETGMIRPDDIVNAVIGKEYTITAHVEKTKEHYAADAHYTVVIEAPEGGNVETAPETGTFDFTTLEKDGSRPYYLFPFTSMPANDKNSSNEDVYELNLDQQTDDKYLGHTSISHIVSKDNDVLTIDFEGNYRSWESGFGDNTSYTLRIYKEGKINIKSNRGDIEKIVLVGKSLNKIEAQGTKGEYKSSTGIWSATEKTSEVTFKYTQTSSYSEINTITVTLNMPTSSGSEKLESGLGFDDSKDGEERYFNIFEDQSITLPYVLEHADGLSFDDIILDIDEIDEIDEEEGYRNYEIVGTDWDDIKITVYDPGVYTFRAKYEKEDGKFLKGMAILRLNVFPRLDVLPNDEGKLADDDRTSAPELTLAHPDEEKGETATIALPKISDLEDDLKYSTIHVSKVEIKEGNEIITYAETGADKTLEELEDSHEFGDDGYVKYSLTYANTADFTGDATVHVVLMPNWVYNPTAVSGVPVITPTNHSYIQYCTFIYDPKKVKLPGDAPEPDYGDAKTFGNRVKSKVDAEDNTEWKLASTGMTIQDFQNEGGDIPDGMKLGVKFRTVKDINDITGLSLDDSTLESGYGIFTIDSAGMPTGIDEINYEEESDSDTVYYNLNGMRLNKPESGVIIIVKDGQSRKVIF